MKEMIGYMLTWTTYGSWLQGDERGFVKDGVSCTADSRLYRANAKLLKKPAVKLTPKHKQIIHDEIHKAADHIGQKIFCLAVCSNHVHIVVGNSDRKISDIVRYYKRRTTYSLKMLGVDGKIWTNGYDKRYCYDEKSLRTRIEYVQKHLDG